MNPRDEEEKLLNAMIKGERAAVETYKQLIEKVITGLPEAEELEHIVADHEEAVNRLTRHLEELEIKPAEDSGLWGVWAKIVEKVSGSFGASAALKALEEGERIGIGEYEDAVRDKALDEEARTIIRTFLLPRSKAHLPVLDRVSQMQNHPH